MREGAVTFDALDPHHCRYAYGEALPYTFCAEPQRSGSSYCAVHHMLCTEVQIPRARQPDEKRARRKVSRFALEAMR